MTPLAIVHHTVFGDKLDETLSLLLDGAYLLRPADSWTGPDGPRTTVLDPVDPSPDAFGLGPSSIHLHRHVAGCDQATAVSHAVACLRSLRVGRAVQDRTEEALTAVMNATAGSVPYLADATVEATSATPWGPLRVSWWADEDGPRDGTVEAAPGVDTSGILPPTVVIDHHVDQEGRGRLGIAPVMLTLHGRSLDASPMEVLRTLRGLAERPLAPGDNP